MFTPPRQTVVSETPQLLAVADFDRDGDADVVAGHLDSFTLLLNDGEGGLSPQRRVDMPDDWIGIGCSALATADFNLDGNPDLVFGAAGTTPGLFHTCVLLGQGDGSFVLGFGYSSPRPPRDLVAADVDSDGITDLLYSSFDAFCLLRGKGDGTFGHEEFTVVSPSPHEIWYGPIDEDGTGDLLVSLRDGARGIFRLAFFRGDGDGSFTPGAEAEIPAGSTSPITYDILVADFGADGMDDILISRAGAQDIVRFLDYADGAFGPISHIPIEAPRGAMAAMDADLDGDLDLLLTGDDANDRGLSLVPFTATGEPEPYVLYPGPDRPNDIDLADLNGDGLLDVVAQSSDFGIDLTVFTYLNRSAGTLNCTEDLDCDGTIGFADALAVLASWGDCDLCRADFDMSGHVGFDDLLRVTAFTWGPCRPERP